MTSVLALVVALHAPTVHAAPPAVYRAVPAVYHPPPIYRPAPAVYHFAPAVPRPTLPMHAVLPLPVRAMPPANSVAFPDQSAAPRWTWPGLWNSAPLWQPNPYCSGAGTSYWGEWGMLATPSDVYAAYEFGPWGPGNAWLPGNGLQTFCGAPPFIGY